MAATSSNALTFAAAPLPSLQQSIIPQGSPALRGAAA
eukprot:CAMPEP_0177401742 /NCGR_PEP_ID=MMETSP0368-20130122/59808_1 /TAXON_ID=447022 ORGANISM="Scrippsiella hangoei-like, Strain SHHI-4" /NCGR_SAMPLE_ID=MMETSP0368 /ASSEMBLY_ACC=CAM_ASM_000363 /LENGTH=36 /DNA_ID= /DNA_START= /DNA_END= /DNA_ORIENTATION=